MKYRILIAGGGTGGHVYPALATIEALQKKAEIEVLYVGSRRGIEREIVQGRGIPMETIWISGFQRSLTAKNLLFPIKLLVSLWQSRRIIKQFQPHVAIGTGGYVSGPILYMAARRGIPVLIQEQDVHPGVTTRLLARHASCICLAFEDARHHFVDYSSKIVVTGNPVRGDLTGYPKKEALQHWGFSDEKPVLLIFGGSQGARAINSAVMEILPELRKRLAVQVIWQTGQRDYSRVNQVEWVKERWIRLLPFISEMGLAYTAADLVVSRAGAITLAELAQVRKPAILIPYPHAAGKHQEFNARMAANAGAAHVILESPGWETQLLQAIESLLRDSEKRQEMARNWEKISRENAAEKIADEVLRLIEQRGMENEPLRLAKSELKETVTANGRIRG